MYGDLPYFFIKVIIMSQATAQRQERIEMRVDTETKVLAERASAVLGCASVTEYLTSLIRENAPKSLQEAATIQLTNQQFDNFILACDDPNRQPSKRLLSAAKALDKEGF